MKNKSRDKKSSGQKFENLLTAAGTILCISTVTGFLCCYSWFLDLFSHFRMQYFIGLLIISILLLILKSYKKSLIMAGFALINFVLILPFYIPQSLQKKPDSQLKTMLINVNAKLGDLEKIKEAIRINNPDFIVLEEISSNWVKNLESLKREFPFTIMEPREDNFGIALYSKLPIKNGKIIKIGSAGVPSIEAFLQTDSDKLKVIATHPPPPVSQDYTSLRNDQLKKLAEKSGDDNPLIIIGDLNCSPWSYHFKKLLEASRLKNSMKGFGIQPSWPAHFLLPGVPIDHLLHSDDISIIARRTGTNVSSDHLPLIVDFAINSKSNSKTGN